jgi:hypothetical protein
MRATSCGCQSAGVLVGVPTVVVQTGLVALIGIVQVVVAGNFVPSPVPL